MLTLLLICAIHLPLVALEVPVLSPNATLYSSDTDVIDGRAIVEGVVLIHMGQVYPIERYALLCKHFNLTVLTNVAANQRAMATKADEFCRTVLENRDKARQMRRKGTLFKVSEGPVSIAQNRILCDQVGAQLPQLVGNSGDERQRLMNFMNEHGIKAVYLDMYFDGQSMIHKDRISAKPIGALYSKFERPRVCKETQPAEFTFNGTVSTQAVCIQYEDYDFWNWEKMETRRDAALLITHNGTLEAFRPTFPWTVEKAWGVCVGQLGDEPVGEIDEPALFMKEQCWNTVSDVSNRADRYEHYLNELFGAYQVAQKAAVKPSFEYDRLSNASRAKRDTYTEEGSTDWRAGNIAVGVLENFIPLVGPIYSRIQMDNLLAESIDHKKYVKQLQVAVADMSVTVKDLVVGFDSMQDQMEDMHTITKRLLEEVQNTRAEAQLGLMLQSVDEASRSLDASARGAANEFEDLISAVMNQQTPVSLWSFREIESLQEAATKTDYERIHPQHSEMLSYVIPSGNAQTLSILTRAPIKGRAAELYETLPLAHVTEEHGMVRPILQHRFILASGREYQVLSESEVRNCLGKACVLTGEVKIASTDECGIPLAIQSGSGNCPVQHVPAMNYLDSSYDRKHLLYSVIRPLTLELYCPLLHSRPIQTITVSNSGLLDVPVGCKFVDPQAHVTYLGPVGITKSLFSVRDTRDFNLNYQARTVVLRSDIPVIPMTDFKRTHIQSKVAAFVPIPGKSHDYSYIAIGAAIGILVLALTVGLCCFIRWKSQIVKTTSGLGTELATLAGRLIANGIGSRQPSQEGLDEPFISNELAIYDPSRGSPPNERRDAYVTHKRAPKVDLETGIVKGIRRLSSFMPVPTSPEATRSPSPNAKAPFSPGASLASTRKVQFAAKSRSRQAWPESATEDASDVSDSDATMDTVLDARRIGTKQKYAPTPNIDEFMRHANLSIEPSRDFPPPAPERNSSIVPSPASAAFSHSPSGLRRYPPATRASQQDDVEHVPSPSPSRHSRNASVSLPPTSPGMSRHARSDSVSLPPPPPAQPAQPKH
jgi:hypothetical protein